MAWNILRIFLLVFVTALSAFAQNGREFITQDSKTGAVQNVKPSNFTPGQLQVNAIAVTTPQYQTITFSSAGSTSSNTSTSFHITYITANAGAGTYTATFPIPDANRAAGDAEIVHIHFAASTNPTIEIHDNTAGGTLLFTWTGDGTVTDIYVDCRFNGSAWYLNDAHFIQ
jgi:hypothetical protein